MKRRTLSILIAACLLIGAIGNAHANGTWMGASGISTCTTCHGPGGPPLTQYGQFLVDAPAILSAAKLPAAPADAFTCVGPPPGKACVAAQPPPTCTSFTYSPWSPCVNNAQNRMVTDQAPAGCAGGAPVTSQACTPAPTAPPTCTSFTYSPWSACDTATSTQTRTVTGQTPAGCTGGAPEALTQACGTPAADKIPVPAQKQTFYFAAVENPVVDADPAKAKPIGVGPIANNGETLEIRLALGEFAAPVDISFGIYALAIDPVDVFFLDNRRNLKPLSRRLLEAALDLNTSRPADSKEEEDDDEDDEDVKNEAQKRMVWKSSVTSLNESVFGAIPALALPEGVYMLMVKASPAGKQNAHYLWVTSFVVQ